MNDGVFSLWNGQLPLYDVPADVAAEAVEEPLVGHDVEGGRLLRVEGAEAFVAGSGALQRNVLLHDLQDVRLQAEVVDEWLRKQTHLQSTIRDGQ